MDFAGARLVRRADLLLHLVHSGHLDVGLGRDRSQSGKGGSGKLPTDRSGPDLLGHNPAHGRVLRRHLRRANRSGPGLCRAPALESEARRGLQGDHLYPGRPRPGYHGAGLPGDICPRRPVQLAARARRARLPCATMARPGKHRASGAHGDHRVAVDRPHVRALLRGHGADRPIGDRSGPDRRRRQLPHAGPRNLAGRARHDPSHGHPQRHRRPEDLRHPVPGDRRGPQLRHRVPRHLHLPKDHSTVARRLRRGPFDHPAGPGVGHGAHPADPRRGTEGGPLMFEVRTRWGRILLQVVITLLVLPYLFPLFAMVQGSLAGDGWGNYQAVLAVPGLWRFFVNTVVIAAGVIVIVYVVTMLAAYGFGKLRIRGREVYFWMLLACLTLPEVVLLTPLFTTAQAFGFFDTYWAVILPLGALQVPFAVLLARNFVQGIPDELFEAARVDGGTVINGFRHLVITLIGAWNNYLFPLVFLQSTEMQTITLVPQFFVGQFSNDQTKILASAVLTAIPEVVAYLCLQRLFERGLAAGAIK